MEIIFGKLSLDAILHGPIETLAQLSVIGGALAIAAILTYFKRWSWIWREWLTALDPKKIGVMYLVLALVMLVRGAIDALMMRSQQALAVGDSVGYLSPDHFAQIFTAHGVIMIFFVAMPAMFGVINYIVPLQIGSRDVAFPFLNAMSLWLTVAGAMMLNCSLVIGEFAATGWLAYPPLSELEFSPGVGVDYYIWALQIAGAGSLMSAINFIVTIIKMRAPGMTLMRMPVYTWTVLGSMILVLFVFPILTATLAMLSLDRTLGMHFFTTDLGGNAMMYVNLIWAWGHPEVYILVLPFFGAFSEIVAVFSQKKLFGYLSMVVATMLIVILSFIVWVHHFFTMGAGANVNAFFGIMTMAIAIPTGVKIFNWLFTMFRGRVRFDTPMLWFMGFLGTFILGGMTGVMLSIPGIDFQLHNSLFLVAHFHNMVIGGVLFGFFAAVSYWFPKIAGFKLDERIGTWAFWCWLGGFFVAFVPIYILGFMGMTRRLDTIGTSVEWQPLLLIALIGAVIIGIGFILQVVQLIVSIYRRVEYRDLTGDPWNGRTLEWATASPPPIYNFSHIPHVHGRDAYLIMKEEGLVKHGNGFEDIRMPKNTPLGLVVAIFSFLMGFGIVWHIWWLGVLGLIGIAATIILRSFDDEPEFVISASEVARSENHTAHVWL